MLFCGPQNHQNASRNAKTTPRSLPKGPKRPQVHPQKAPRGTQKRPKNEAKPQDEKRTEPRRSQDRLGPPKGSISIVRPPLWGAILAPKTASKSTLKRSKIETKNQVEKKAIQDHLGPILERSWAVLGRPLGRKNTPNLIKRDVS